MAFDAGVILDGYVGELGRTRAVGRDATGDQPLLGPWCELWDRLIERCRVGAPLRDLLDAYEEAGLSPPPMPVARGLGLGFDLPLVDARAPDGCGRGTHRGGRMVFALTALVWKQGRGALYVHEPVYISATGPELLCTTPFREERKP